MTPRANCSLVEHWIYLSLDGELSGELEKQLELHLDECVECRRSHQAAARQQELLDAEFLSISSTMDDLLRDQLAEDRLLVPRTPSRRAVLRALRWPLLAGAAAASVLLFVAVALITGLESGSDVETIAQLKWFGGVEVGRTELGGGSERPFHLDEWIRVPGGAGAELKLADGTVVTLLGGTRCAVLREDDRSLRVELATGGVELDVVPSRAGLAVVTDVARVEVLGTRFTVHHDPAAKETRIEVHEGRVGVKATGMEQIHELAAGETCRAFSGQILSGEWRYDPVTEEWQHDRTKRDTHILVEHGRARGAELDEVPQPPVRRFIRDGERRRPLDLPTPTDAGLDFDEEDEEDEEKDP